MSEAVNDGVSEAAADVDTAPTPSDADVQIGEWKRVNPLSMVTQGLNILARAIIPLGFLVYSIGKDGDEPSGLAALIAGGVFLLILTIMGVATWLGWYRLRYQVSETDVRVEQGIVSRNARAVPYERIQDVSLEQKLLPRLLGLVEIKFETGAGGKEELKLAYVSREEGENLREAVRALVDGGSPAPIAAAKPGESAQNAPAEAEGSTIFAMDNTRLFKFGLFEFSLVIFAVILGAVQQLEFLLPFDAWDYIEGFFRNGTAFEAGRYVDGMGTIARILGVLYLLATVLIVGMLSGMGKTFLRHWEFRLDRTAKGFRRRRGLLTKTDVVMPVHRVQALVVATGWLRRRFGWHGLSFISLAQDSGKANHDVAPFAKMHEIEPIAREAGFTLPGAAQEWHRPSADFYFDRAVIKALAAVMAGIIALAAAASSAGEFRPGMAIIAAVILAIVGITVLREFYLWRYDRHALDPAQILSRRGWLSPRTQIANRVKLHSVEISQNLWSRWRGYCTLRFGMAGGRMAFVGLKREDAEALRAAVLDSIAEVDFAHLPR